MGCWLVYSHVESRVGTRFAFDGEHVLVDVVGGLGLHVDASAWDK